MKKNTRKIITQNLLSESNFYINYYYYYYTIIGCVLPFIIVLPCKTYIRTDISYFHWTTHTHADMNLYNGQKEVFSIKYDQNTCRYSHVYGRINVLFPNNSTSVIYDLLYFDILNIIFLLFFVSRCFFSFRPDWDWTNRGY